MFLKNSVFLRNTVFCKFGLVGRCSREFSGASGENLIDEASFGSSEKIGEKLAFSEKVTLQRKNIVCLKNQVYLTNKLSLSVDKPGFSEKN